MTKASRRSAKGGLLPATGLVLMALASGCLGGPPGGDDAYHPVSTFADVHGLAVSPDEPAHLYVATHHGLIRGVADGNWSRVGDSRDDHMGFTMHPGKGGVFWRSGHPAGGGNLGVQKSTDGGFTWKTLALPHVDFHAMAASPADPDRLWGFWAGSIYRSDDGGHTWETLGPPGLAVGAFAPLSHDRDHLLASTSEGVMRSTDGGTSWQVVTDRPVAGLGASPHDADLILAAFGPGLERSTDGGQTWERLELDTKGGLVGHVAFDWQDPDVAYVATYQAAIHKTTDGGATWRTVKPGER